MPVTHHEHVQKYQELEFQSPNITGNQYESLRVSTGSLTFRTSVRLTKSNLQEACSLAMFWNVVCILG